jgi:putative transposase
MRHAAGQYYHVYNRGVDHQPIFVSDENYHFLLKRIKEYLPFYAIQIVAYCLIPNHYHFLVHVVEDGALSSFFQRLFNSYTQAFNLQQGRKGTLFEGRAKSKLVGETSYVYALTRYIHLNPVTAQLVHDPSEWPYSDYLDWTGKRQGKLFADEFRAMFFSSSEEYRQFVLSDIPYAMERKLAKYLLG